MWRLRGTSELAGTSLVEKLSKFGTGATFDHVARHEAVAVRAWHGYVHISEESSWRSQS